MRPASSPAPTCRCAPSPDSHVDQTGIPASVGAGPDRRDVAAQPAGDVADGDDVRHAGGLPSERTRDYFAARAKGGVGLITVGANGNRPSPPRDAGGLAPGHRRGSRCPSRAGRGGARARRQDSAADRARRPRRAGARDARRRFHRAVGHPVVPDRAAVGRGHPRQLVEVFDLFKAAVRRAAEAGYDGIELHAAHGYMFLGSFLAPQRNRRTDDYRGDSVKGRIRVVLEALAAIRSEIGDDLPITLRISGYERVAGRSADVRNRPGGTAIGGGRGGRVPCQRRRDRPARHRDGQRRRRRRRPQRRCRAARSRGGRRAGDRRRPHPSPERAERILADGRADFIAMGRPMLADPELPNKLATGQSDRVRKCISCENCIDAMEQRFSVDCAVNPRTGKERELAVHPAARPQAGRGDRQRAGAWSRPRGGRPRAPRHAVRTRRSTRRRAAVGVDPRIPRTSRSCGTCATRSAAAPSRSVLRPRSFADDVVALRPTRWWWPPAAGSCCRASPVPGCRTCERSGAAGVWVVGVSGWSRPPRSGWRRGWMPLGHRVVIVGADLGRLELAEFLAARGRLVSVLEPGKDDRAGGGQQAQDRAHGPPRPPGRRRPRATASRRSCPTAWSSPPRGGPAGTSPPTASSWPATLEPNSELYEKLVAALPNTTVTAAGDCTGLGLIRKATEDGARAACAI